MLEKILRHCGLRADPPPRAPPPSLLSAADFDARRTFEPDPDFEEHRRRKANEQLAFGD